MIDLKSIKTEDGNIDYLSIINIFHETKDEYMLGEGYGEVYKNSEGEYIFCVRSVYNSISVTEQEYLFPHDILNKWEHGLTKEGFYRFKFIGIFVHSVTVNYGYEDWYEGETDPFILVKFVKFEYYESVESDLPF